jgi:hypothetical protein
MAKEITDKQVIDLLKKHPGESMQFYATKLGIQLGAVGAIVWRLEPQADASLKFNGTPAAIVAARDKEGMRWERIAARTGKTISEVKKLYSEKSGVDASQSYTGRGRNFSGTASSAKPSATAGAKRGATGTSGRRAAGAKPAAAGKPAGSGRRGATAAAKPAAGAKRGTRASADPK